MSLEGTVKIPGIGAVPKKGAVYGTAAIVVVGGGIWWYRKHHPAAALASSAAGPAAGLNARHAPGPFDTSQLGGGGLSGYYYGRGRSVPQSPPGPGNFADNAEWSQYVISYLTQQLNASPGKLGDALGAYLEGQPVDQDQLTLIEEAIAIGGRPPQAGPAGYPPRIRLEADRKPRPKPKVDVPDVTNKTYDYARMILAARDLRARREGTGPAVAAQKPDPGDQADRGSTVTLHMGPFHAEPGG